METQSAIMDMDIFQTRLGVMLQWATHQISKSILDVFNIVYMSPIPQLIFS